MKKLLSKQLNYFVYSLGFKVSTILS